LAEPVPLHLGPTRRADPLVEDLAAGIAAMIRYRIAVVDREDRLEVGSGEWLAGFLADDDARAGAVRDVVLRALRIGLDPIEFRILEALAGEETRTTAELEAVAGMGRVALDERIGDLVSAGLAAKVPEADQVAGTAAGRALVAFVAQLVDAADRHVAEGR